MTATVSTLAALVGGKVVGDGNREIRGVADLRSAGPDKIGFVRDGKYRAAAATSKAGALLTFAEIDSGPTQIVVDDVSVAYAKVALHFHPLPTAKEHRIHPTAVVHPEAELEAPVEVGPHAVVGRARIGAGTVLAAGVVVGDGCAVGRACGLFPRVVLYNGSVLGDRVVVHAGSVLGADGFGYAKDGVEFIKVPQLGIVRIGDDVEIGANCAIDRAAMGETRIGDRTKIDNMCHIAHNVVCGVDCVFAGGTFIAGSAVIGDRVTLAGHIVMAGHINIADEVRIGGASTVLKSVDRAGDYMGYPLVEKKLFLRNLAAQGNLAEIQSELIELRREVRRLSGNGSN